MLFSSKSSGARETGNLAEDETSPTFHPRGVILCAPCNHYKTTGKRPPAVPKKVPGRRLLYYFWASEQGIVYSGQLPSHSDLAQMSLFARMAVVVLDFASLERTHTYIGWLLAPWSQNASLCALKNIWCVSSLEAGFGVLEGTQHLARIQAFGLHSLHCQDRAATSLTSIEKWRAPLVQGACVNIHPQ